MMEVQQTYSEGDGYIYTYIVGEIIDFLECFVSLINFDIFEEELKDGEREREREREGEEE